jgi:hypothetical protein
MIRFSAFSLKLALGAAAALAAISLSPGSAQAFVVTVGGLQYDVTTFTGSFNSNIGKFALPPAPGEMPWWSSSTLAEQFRDQVGSGLGFPNYNATHGPLFAYSVLDNGNIGTCYVLNNNNDSGCGQAGTDEVRTYAQAAQVPASVPGPLPALGAAAAFGFSRKLRKRIKLAPGAFSSALPRA